MKKITFLIAVLTLIGGMVFAQKHVDKSISSKVQTITSDAKRLPDTLMPATFLTAGCDSLFIYTASGGGFVTGNNGYDDMEKAEKSYLTGYTGVIKVTNVLADMYTNTTASTGTTEMKIYGVNPVTKGPRTSSVLGTSNTVAINTFVAGALTNYTFATPVTVDTAFFTSFVPTYAAGDTAAVYQSKEGCWSNDSLAWEKWSDNTWHSMYTAWGSFKMDLAIFPVISTGTGLDEYFINGIKLEQNQPNPASATTLIQYEVKNNSNVSLQVFDITGRIVLTMDEGNQLAGLHTIVIDANKLQSGTYFYSLKAGEKRLTKKMVIE